MASQKKSAHTGGSCPECTGPLKKETKSIYYVCAGCTSVYSPQEVRQLAPRKV